MIVNTTGNVSATCHQDDLMLDFTETIFVGRTPSFDTKRFILRDGRLYFYRKRADDFELIAIFERYNEQIISKISHWCSPDCYGSVLSYQHDVVVLDITVKGRYKDERIVWTYR